MALPLPASLEPILFVFSPAELHVELQLVVMFSGTLLHKEIRLNTEATIEFYQHLHRSNAKIDNKMAKIIHPSHQAPNHLGSNVFIVGVNVGEM